jgi:hypothetical protein
LVVLPLLNFLEKLFFRSLHPLLAWARAYLHDFSVRVDVADRIIELIEGICLLTRGRTGQLPFRALCETKTYLTNDPLAEDNSPHYRPLRLVTRLHKPIRSLNPAVCNLKRLLQDITEEKVLGHSSLVRECRVVTLGLLATLKVKLRYVSRMTPETFFKMALEFLLSTNRTLMPLLT